ncbi:MAG: EAL domain-containing protein [Gammaproteobacteria bacterium]|nr:EAL domain-containing protein [Gammaproteobacteria bacterium]
MGSSVGIPLIVISRSDDHATTINSILRDSGHPVHCLRVNDVAALADQAKAAPPELVLYFAGETDVDLAAAVAVLAQCSPPPPVLLVQPKVDEAAIAAAMAKGARDVVSLTSRDRLAAVVGRELHAHRLRLALEGVLSSARQYKQELRSLMTGASEAIADVHEGIIVAVNPAWAALLGFGAEEELVGQPFMDLFREADQATLKGALVACLRDKWQEDGTLPVVAYGKDESEVPLELRLKRVTVDGEPAVRVIVPGDRHAEQPPEELLEHAVARDPSTGFYLRHYFLEQLTARMAKQQEGGIRALAYIRPDHFSRVQADVGLLGTEALLMRVAEILRELMQPGDLYGRFGGTMFTVLLERGTMTDVQAWANQLRKAVANQVFEVETQSTSMSCTIGLCEVRPADQDPGELLAEAEAACRKGRDQGGNRIVLSDSTSVTERLRQTDTLWVARIRAALMQNRLRLVHQPVVGLHEEVQGVLDTRVRLIDEQGEPVLPADFIPAAERAHMMKNIDRWVIGASFSFCVARQPNLVFVRLSRDSVVDDSLLEWLKARAQSTRLRPGQVCFQISEELALQQLKQSKALAEKLRENGFLFAVDHLGTGRDSTQLLAHLPMQFVKVDGSLMQGLHRDKDLQRKVGDIAARARELKIKTIAERVENANTMAVLWQLGIAFVQGNFTQTHGVVLGDSGQQGQQAAG